MSLQKTRIYDDALPAAVFARLKDAIESMQTCVQETWFDTARAPRNIVELVIASLRSTVRPEKEFAGAEWWVRRAPSPSVKTLHFDKDEALAATGELVHPTWASVLYLTNVGGDTLVTDQRAADDGLRLIPPEPKTRLLVKPRENRYLVFDGSLLHGVLPARKDHAAERISLLINWWDRRLSNADAREPSNEALGLRTESIALAERRLTPSASIARQCVIVRRGSAI